MYDTVENKLIRSRDFFFLENQTIENIDKDDKPSSSNDIPTSLDSDSVSVPVNVDHGGAETKQREDIDGDDTATDEFV